MTVGTGNAALAVVAELEVAYAGAQIERALTEPIASTASLPKHHRSLNHARSELEKRGRLTPELEERAQQGSERLVRYRAQRKLDEAAVAEAGGNAKKAGRLRAEAGVVWAQDYAKALPGALVPPLGDLGGQPGGLK